MQHAAPNGNGSRIMPGVYRSAREIVLLESGSGTRSSATDQIFSEAERHQYGGDRREENHHVESQERCAT